MVVAPLDGLDQLGHAVAGHRGVLELITARPDGYVETGQVGPVVDRDPVVGHVVEVDDALLLGRHTEVGHAAGQAQHLGVPLLVGHHVVEDVGVVHPDLRVACWVFGADKDVVARLGPDVDGQVGVRRVKAILFEIQVGRRRDVVHLVAQGLGLDVHGVVHAGHLVDDKRVRSGHVDHHRCVDLGTVGQRDPGHPVIGPPDFDHLSIEAELATLGLGGPLQVVGG